MRWLLLCGEEDESGGRVGRRCTTLRSTVRLADAAHYADTRRTRPSRSAAVSVATLGQARVRRIPYVSCRDQLYE